MIYEIESNNEGTKSKHFPFTHIDAHILFAENSTSCSKFGSVDQTKVGARVVLAKLKCFT